MRPLSIALLLAIVAVLAFGATFVFYSNTQIVTTRDFPMVGWVTQTQTGFGFNGSKIFFGKITPGGASWREIRVANNESFPVQALLILRGEIAPFIEPEADAFLLKPGEVRVVRLYFRAPVSAPLGYYTGVLRVVIRK